MLSRATVSTQRCVAMQISRTSAFAPQMTESSLNPFVVKAQYAVRGEVVQKADSLRQQLAKDPKSLPFDKVVSCNIGNPQELGQKPITFFRQVLALCHCPQLLEDEAALKLFPSDAVERAKAYLKAIPGGTGAYSASAGVSIVRKEVADFIAERDGHAADPESILLSDGASSAVKLVLTALIRGPNDGVMIPIPQYPLYSASLALFDGAGVPYYLDESKGWGIAVSELEASLKRNRESSPNMQPRALVVINPGNPTGQCLDVDTMRDIVRLCERERLVLMADEVYQV